MSRRQPIGPSRCQGSSSFLRPELTERCGRAWLCPAAQEDAGAFKKCAACHTLTLGINGLGPSLAGIYGKPAAMREGYRYSDELSQSGLVWDAATLDAFLAAPKQRVPGTKMPFRGLSDPADRAQVIALIQRH